VRGQRRGRFADDLHRRARAGDGAAVLVIRHADGGFRRFDVLADGTLAEADGTQRARSCAPAARST
jgi:hypothetical protein